MTELENIIEIIKKLNVNFNHSDNEKYNECFNPLSIMSNEVIRKEIVHSNILSILLDPNSKHDFGYNIVKLFLKRVGFILDENQVSIFKVYSEYAIKTSNSNSKTINRYIDILIRWEIEDKTYAVIIENKLNNAPDQKNQLNDYYEAIKQETDYVKIVYMHLSPYKSFIHTDILEEYKKFAVNFSMKDIIQLLDDSSKNMTAIKKIYNVQIYRDYLQDILLNYNNYMKSENIQKQLLNNPKEFKQLVELSNIISSTDWNNSKYKITEEKLIEKEKKLEGLIVNTKGKYGEFFYRPFLYWVELWGYQDEINLYICSYEKYSDVKIGEMVFKLHNENPESNGKYYYKNEKKFNFEYPEMLNGLIENLVPILLKLKNYEKKKDSLNDN